MAGDRVRRLLSGTQHHELLWLWLPPSLFRMVRVALPSERPEKAAAERRPLFLDINTFAYGTPSDAVEVAGEAVFMSWVLA